MTVGKQAGRTHACAPTGYGSDAAASHLSQGVTVSGQAGRTRGCAPTGYGSDDTAFHLSRGVTVGKQAGRTHGCAPTGWYIAFKTQCRPNVLFNKRCLSPDFPDCPAVFVVSSLKIPSEASRRTSISVLRRWQVACRCHQRRPLSQPVR